MADSVVAQAVAACVSGLFSASHGSRSLPASHFLSSTEGVWLFQIAMDWRVALAVFLLASASRGQAPADAEEARSILEEARQTALNYSKWLPDFICTEVIHRYEAYGPNGAFRSADSLTLQVSYFQLHENYKLVARNNHSTSQNLASVGGVFSLGEFGSNLLLIFHPVSKAEIAFKEWTTVRGHRAVVYTYRVERANSHFELRVATDSVTAGYHGEVSIDAASHLVLRIAQVIDIPDGFPILYSHSTGEYDFVAVAGHQYLLPVHYESWSADPPIPYGGIPGPGPQSAGSTPICSTSNVRLNCTPSRRNSPNVNTPSGRLAQQKRYHNVIEFRNYRKYAADSTLTFDAPEGAAAKSRR